MLLKSMGPSQLIQVQYNMLGLLKNQTYVIGVDVGNDSLKLAQLGSNGQGTSVIAGNRKQRPAEIEPDRKSVE